SSAYLLCTRSRYNESYRISYKLRQARLHEEITTDFGQWLRERRRALGLTRQQLALCVGCSSITIEKIEKGERRPSEQIATLLASCVHVQAESLDDFVQFARGRSVPSPPTSSTGARGGDEERS